MSCIVNNSWIYWEFSNPNEFSTSSTYPTLTENDFIIGRDYNGAFIPSWKVGQGNPTGIDSPFSIQTDGDFICKVNGKGLVLRNASGSLIRRVRLNDTGDGLIFEEPYIDV